MKIPFYNFARQHDEIKDKLKELIGKVFEIKELYSYEKIIKSFEQDFCEYAGTKHCISTDSGTSALQLALLASGVRAGDKVITTANSYIATALAVSNIGAKPVFVDVHEKTQNINENKIKTAITEKTRAIIPVHLHGLPAEMSPILEIAKDAGLIVIEDACQAHGADYDGKRVGSFGDCGCFSFHSSKNLGCIGDGGMVTTNDKGIMNTLKSLVEPDNNTGIIRLSGRTPCTLSPIQAAILNVKLKYLDKWNREKRENAEKYAELIKNKDIILPSELPKAKHVYRDYCIRHKKRDDLKEFLAKKDIETAIHYKIPIHLTKTFSYLGYSKGFLPQTEKLSNEILSLPIFIGISDEEIQFVADAVNEFK